MVNTLELEIVMLRKGITKRQLASLLGISEQGLWKKMHNKSQFKAGELYIVCTTLELPLDSPIFFSNISDYKSLLINKS